MDNTAEKPADKVDNTSLTSDLDGNVNTQFKLTPGSQQQVSEWTMWTDGQAGAPPGLSFDQSSGQLTGQVQANAANKNYKVEAKAFDSSGNLIDSREYNFYPKTSDTKGDAVKFVYPYENSAGNGGRVTSGFGPRKQPTAGASSVHKGIDIASSSAGGKGKGNVLSAADGTVVYAGPAKGYGNKVVIEHRDAQGNVAATTVYGHMESDGIYVKPGQKVAAGQKIAKEGNAGASTGSHLHFEMHKGKLGNPVDPIPYLNGEMDVAQQNLPGQNSEPDPNSFQRVSNQNTGMTAGESQAAGDCPDEIPGQFGSSQPNRSNDSPSSQVTGAQGTDQSATEPSEIPRSTDPTKAQTQDAIQRALDEDPTLTAEDKKHLMFVAKIESGFDADAKNPNSSARGVYQMLDKTANKYYGEIGVAPTTANRNDPYLATKAQIEFYKQEQKPYWNEFQNSGGTRIAGQTLSPATQSRYANLTQGEFTYGLIHHDGVGNAVRGRDMQGVDYYRSRVRQSS